MKTITVNQGSPVWAALRAKHNTASEAPVMMGASKYQTRDDLMRQKVTGIMPEVGRHQQAIFDKGHATEAAARTVLEEMTGEDFYPVTAVSDDGTLLASMDGITLDDSTLFEHKLWNEKLAGSVRAGDLDPHYYWQLEQQLLVSGAKKVIFVCSDGTRDNWAQMDYYPVKGRAEQLKAGWAQFDIDKAAYVPVEATAALAPTGRAPETLPALFITVKGEVTDSNLANFKEVALAAIRSVNRELSTDQDFADADKAVKWCSDIEERVAGAKQNALSQTASIDALFKTMDDISAEARDVRLSLDKLIKARKESIRVELIHDAINAFGKHVDGLNARIGKKYMPPVPTDFPGVIKGKRTLDSLRDAVNTELARAKIAANEIADRVQVNANYLHSAAAEYQHLFPDTATIVLKANDDLTALVKTRIAEHQANELAKEEATRERIRAEEVARLEREQADAERRRIADIAAHEKLEADEISRLDRWSKAMAVEVPVANVVPLRASQPASVAQTPPSMKLGDLNAMLSPITLTADGLETLGFPVAAMVKGAKLYHASDLTRICGALHDLIDRVQAKQAA